MRQKFYKPYDCDVKEYEARLASSREIWDDYSHEWWKKRAISSQSNR